MLLLATRVGRISPTPRLIPWPPLFLFCSQPSHDIPESLVANVDERLNHRKTTLVNRFDRDACFLFLFPARGINAQVAQLQDEAFLRIDKKALLDALPKSD